MYSTTAISDIRDLLPATAYCGWAQYEALEPAHNFTDLDGKQLGGGGG